MGKQDTLKMVPFTFTAAEIKQARAGNFEPAEKRVRAELQRRARKTDAASVGARSSRKRKV